MRRVFRIAALTTSGALTTIACTTDYQKGLEDPNYGAPNALAGQKPPGASAAESKATTGAPAGQPICVQKGGTLIDAKDCKVSFKTDVMKALSAGNCGNPGCHASGGIPPKVDFNDPAGTYTDFATFTPRNGKPYVNPCSKTAADSAISQNIDLNAPAADRGTVMPPSVGLAAAVKITQDWVACGAPNN